MIHEDHRVSETVAAVVCLVLIVRIQEGCTSEWVAKATAMVLETTRRDLILKLLIRLKLL